MKIDHTIKMLCFKLNEHGLFKHNYSKEKAKEIVKNCAGVAILTRIIENNEEDILEVLK